MIKEFQYSFEELNISLEDVYDILGFEKGSVPDPFPDLIGEGLNNAHRYCDIKGGFKTFDFIKIDTSQNTIQLDGKSFSPSKIVVTQLKKSTSAALFLCTAGEGISRHSKKLSISGDSVLSYVYDVIGSITVEKAMDKIQKSLESEVMKSGLSVSDRFSPGYCDWNVNEQQLLFSLLPENFCGITLSGSSLMDPIKSVSGIIGIGSGLRQKGYQCKWCNDQNCIYGKTKRKNN
jgi:hypothetical protein